MKSGQVIVILLLLTSMPAVKSLFIPGGFTSHDLIHHVVRQISMDKLLSEGQFPPRWSGELNNGYGYPVFLFNYPLPALVGEIFHKIGMGYVDSVKAVLFLSMISSVIGMYLFLNSLLNSKMGAFLGAVFYLYAPIRFLNVYVSAAVGSALALGILPFVFWSLVEIKNRKKWAIVSGSLSLAGLILAHNVTTLIFAPVLLIFAWVIRGKRVIREIGVMFLLGLGLSAWFWIPAAFEAQYTKFAQIFGDFYKDQFPTIWQLLRSPWGYGLSHPERPESGDMSYQLGLIHTLVMLILVPSLWVFRDIRVIGGFALGFFVLSVFLMLKISLPLWESLPFLALVQFPLRFSAISVLTSSIAAALLVKYLPFKKFLFLSLLFLVLYTNRNHWNINQVFDPGEDYYLQLKTTSTSFGEHLPKWGRMMEKTSPSKLEFVKGVGPPASLPAGTAGEAGEVRVVRDNSAEVLAEVDVSSSSKIRLNQFYFPGWEIKVDGKSAKFDYLTDGLPMFDIDPGSHQIKAEFKNTPVRNVADTISFVTLIAAIIYLCKLPLRK